MNRAQRLLALGSCLALCASAAATIPNTASAETVANLPQPASETIEAPSPEENKAQSDSATASAEAEGETPTSTTEREPVAEEVPDGWHGDTESLWYQQDGERLTNRWLYDNGSWFYFSEEGIVLTGVQKIDGSLYCFDNDGRMQVGWTLCDGTWYHAKSSGALDIGWLYTGGSWYLLADDGSMLTGIQEVNGSSYLLQVNGAMATGWGVDPASGRWCFADASGCLKTGWQYISGTWYLIGDDHLMLTGLQTRGDATYYLQDSGAMATGWAYDEDNSCWYLASSDSSDGRLLAGWQKVGSTWYYLRPDNAQMFTGWYQEGDALYFLKSSGAMAANEWVDYIGNTRLYMSADGHATFEMRNGLIYKDRNTDELASGWVKRDDSWLYINQDGSLAKGWLNLNGTWYYLDPNNGTMRTGWVLVDGLWYWLNSSGAMATGWTNIGSSRWQLDDYTGALHEPEQAPSTDLQRRIVEAARVTPSPGGGLCAMWVSQVFSRAGLGYPEGNACDMFWQWCSRSDLRELKVGMIVAIPSHTHTYLGGIYGHVCIYIGEGMIMDNVGHVRTMSLNGWLEYYTTTYSPKWGWCNNQPLS